MKYLVPKKINLSKISIIDEIKIFKILYKPSNSVNIYGLVIKLDNINIIKNVDNYEIIIKADSLLYTYDKYLSNVIKDYTKIINDDRFIIKYNKLIESYHNKNIKELYLNIKYILKRYNNNIPIINII